MRFELCQAAADGSDRQVHGLDQLLRRVEEGVHELSFEDISAIEESRWFRTARPHLQSLVRYLCEAQIWCGAGVRPRVTIARPEEIGPACDAAMRPLHIVVENDASDGALVEAAVLAFAASRVREVWAAGERAVPRGWTFEHGGGGGDIPRTVRSLGAEQRPGGPRVLVVCDSDRSLPGSEAAPIVKEYERVTEAIGAPRPLVLALREAENYLPDAFWREWLAEDRGRTSYGPLIDALLSLSPDQRDHIKMSGDARLEPGQVPGPLFDGSNPENPAPAADHHRILGGGKRDLKGSGQDKTTGDSRMTIRRLPAMVRSGRVRKEDLESRDRAGTLIKVVRLIEQEL